LSPKAGLALDREIDYQPSRLTGTMERKKMKDSSKQITVSMDRRDFCKKAIKRSSVVAAGKFTPLLSIVFLTLGTFSVQANIRHKGYRDIKCIWQKLFWQKMFWMVKVSQGLTLTILMGYPQYLFNLNNTTLEEEGNE
jgi:hypothetical protein